MLSRMYLWTLVGYDPTASELLSGCNDVLADVMRDVEPRLVAREAFVCRIVEVTRRISVFDLETEYQPTGRTWLGRRTRFDTVCWTEFLGHGSTLASNGWDRDQLWTLARVAELVSRLCGVSYTLRGVSYLLHRNGLTPQVPAHRTAERDEAAIAEWRAVAWEEMRAPARPLRSTPIPVTASLRALPRLPVAAAVGPRSPRLAGLRCPWRPGPGRHRAAVPSRPCPHRGTGGSRLSRRPWAHGHGAGLPRNPRRLSRRRCGRLGPSQVLPEGCRNR